MIFDKLNQFLAVNDYLPHGYCLNWSSWLVLTYVISDILIFLAYASMPLALVYFGRRRKDFPYQWLLWMFAAFIMACGTTHLMGAIVLWQPLYGLDALLKAVTALISVVTAIALWPLLPHALRLPGPNQLRQINEALENEIAERKCVEESLRLAKQAAEDNLQEERILRAAIVEFSEDAIISKTLDGIITSWNQAAEKMFGYRAEEIIGCSASVLIPPEHQAELQKVLVTIQRGESIKFHATERMCKDGSRIIVSVSTSPIRDKEEQIVGVSIIARDITARKLAENEIRLLNADLERRVIERTAELTATNRELDSFSYAVCHDLRAPLRAMCGFSQALIEDYGHQLQGEAKLYLEQIDLAGRNMNELIDGLLALARSTRGELHYDLIDLSSLAGQLLNELQQNAPERQVAVQVEAGLQVQGDARMIKVVMRNLLDNAWKYTAHQPTPSIRVYAEEKEGERRFCVADNGAGFDMAHVNRLFQPFQRLHRQEEFPGIGIGLATVQRIVQRHGGVIGAHAEPGKGAVFHFTLSDMPAKSAGEQETE
ncbi:MAG: PAS domain S-box protein [Methylobacter sp.]|nr:PAS domain S-box protein [Methylobacter sp.]